MMTTTELTSAARFLVRSPRTAAAAVVGIALGAAAVSAVASLLVAALLRPLPFPAADRLVRVWSVEEAGDDRIGVALADLADLRELPSFDRVEAAVRARLIFITDAAGRRVEGEGVTEGYLDLVGARVSRGRPFTSDEHADPGSRVMLLTHEAWGRLFSFADSVVGATIRVPDGAYTVIGVLDRSFTGTIEDDSGELEFFIPAPVGGAAGTSRRAGSAWTLARLAPGEAIGRAQAEVADLGARLAGRYPQERSGTSLRVEPMSENWRGDLRRGLWLLLAAAALLLVVAATNVAGLMLAHGLSRRPEIAVRAALGATRGRTIALLGLEAVGVAVIGGALGLVLGPVLLRIFAGMTRVPVPDYITLEADPAAMGLTVALLGGTTVVAAVVPAVATSRVEAAAVIRAGGRGIAGGRGEQRLRRGLVVFQVALATVLVTSTGVLLRSYHSLQEADLGFRTDRMLRVALFVNTVDAPEMPQVLDLQDRALRAIERQPGVAAVGRIWPTAPLVAAPQTAIRYPRQDERRAETGESASLFAVDPALLGVLDVRLVDGRGFLGSDHADAEPVVIVSASLAGRLRGAEGEGEGEGEGAVGSVVTALGEDRRVVGVIEDVHLTGPRAPSRESRQLFVPLAQFPNRTVSFAIRTVREDAAAVLPDVRRALAEVAPVSALDWTETYEAALGDAFERDRFLIALTTVFSVVTLGLAALGLLALLSYSVAQARLEIGVRQALGATRGRIMGEVVARALGLVGVGLGFGLAFALASTRFFAGLLYGVQPVDPLAFALTAVVLVAGALLASALPARAAARVAPADVLRGQ